MHTVMDPDAYLSNRLFAALMASCLLHAAVLVTPYFGASTTFSRLAVLKPGPARVLNVRLVLENAPATTVAENSAAGAGAADSQGRRPADEEPRPAPERALGADLLPIPAPAYYTTDQLTTRPQPTSQPTLLTPELGPFVPSGKVVLKVWITELGNVASVEVEKSELPEAVAASAAAAFGKLRFVPGQLNGLPVGSMMRIEVVYYDGVGPPP
jgi:TonB family protein